MSREPRLHGQDDDAFLEWLQTTGSRCPTEATRSRSAGSTTGPDIDGPGRAGGLGRGPHRTDDVTRERNN